MNILYFMSCAVSVCDACLHLSSHQIQFWCRCSRCLSVFLFVLCFAVRGPLLIWEGLCLRAPEDETSSDMRSWIIVCSRVLRWTCARKRSSCCRCCRLFSSACLNSALNCSQWSFLIIEAFGKENTTKVRLLVTDHREGRHRKKTAIEFLLQQAERNTKESSVTQTNNKPTLSKKNSQWWTHLRKCVIILLKLQTE